MVKILHTGDIHLDSPMSSLPLSLAEASRDEHRRTFEKMMKYAIDEDVDMILISGDLFDGKYVTQSSRNLVLKYFTEFKKPIILSPGNHDPYSATPLYRDGSMPENVYIFSSEDIQVFDFDELGISVYGYAFVTGVQTGSPLTKFLPKPILEGDNKRVLCAHAEMGFPISNYAPITVPQIEAYSFSYAALGHIHDHTQIKTDKTTIGYCGFLFGRRFDELGEGGAYLVKLDENGTHTERLVFSNRRYMKESLDVSGAIDNGEILGKISAFIKEKGYSEETCLQLTLAGTLPSDLVLNVPMLEASDLGPSILKINDMTTPMPDGNYLANDVSLRGEIYRKLLPKLESNDEDERKCAAEALRLALCAIDGNSLSSILHIEESAQ